MKVEGNSVQFPARIKSTVENAGNVMATAEESRRSLDTALAKAQNPSLLKKIFSFKSTRDKEVAGLQAAQKNIDAMMTMLSNFMAKYYGS